MSFNDERAFNLSKLIGQDLNFVKESFETAQKNMDKLISDINKASMEFERLQLLETTGEASEADLQDLKVAVGKLKFSIPFSLITPFAVDQPNPHINRRPRSTTRVVREVMTQNMTSKPIFDENPPEIQYLWNTSLMDLQEDSIHCLWCFLLFPENTIIKRSLMLYWAKADRICYYETKIGFNGVMADIIARRLVKPVYKNDGMTLGGYWMHPSVRYTLKNCRIFTPLGIERKYVLSSIDEEDIIHTYPKLLLSLKKLRILHLGKWQSSSAPHVEVPEPEIFFKDMDKLSDLRFISLRGISMITEVPEFIANLKHLQVLDLKACHNLEVIPSNINNLWRCLTHLDMSDCYFVDHMPIAIAELRFLEVLKGFFVGETMSNEESCTLENIAHFEYLRKLNIYTSVEGFPNVSQFATLQQFKSLRNLTISWGGCTVKSQGLGSKQPTSAVKDLKRLLTPAKLVGTQLQKTITRNESDFGDQTFSFELEKLDLQCVPETVTRNWLKPANFKSLKKLLIRGGKFCDLGQSLEETGSVAMVEEQWAVEKLVIKHLRKLKMDWSELKFLFPKIICLEKIECPNLTFFPRDGQWMNPARPFSKQNIRKMNREKYPVTTSNS